MAKHTNMQRDVLVTNLEEQLEEIAQEIINQVGCIHKQR